MFSRRSFAKRFLGTLGAIAAAPAILPLVEESDETIELETVIDWGNLPDYSIATMEGDDGIVDQMLTIHSEHSFQKGDLVAFDKNGVAVKADLNSNPRIIGIAVSDKTIQIHGVYHG